MTGTRCTLKSSYIVSPIKYKPPHRLFGLEYPFAFLDNDRRERLTHIHTRHQFRFGGDVLEQQQHFELLQRNVELCFILFFGWESPPEMIPVVRSV
jgi:hypothetical protein